MPESIRWYDLSGAASVVVLDETAQWFGDQAAEFRTTLGRLRADLQLSDWRGPRADRFEQFVDELMGGSLQRLETAFSEAADLLSEQAEQQREASAAPLPLARRDVRS